VHTRHDTAGRALVVGKATPEVEAQQAEENQRVAYVALTRAQVRMYLPLYPAKDCKKQSTYFQIQRCLAPLVSRGDAHFELVEVVAATDPSAPSSALADFDVPAPPAIAELAPSSRGGLAMWSYTRLAHDLEVARTTIPPNVREVERGELDAEPEPEAAEVELPPDELPPGADAGLFLHDLFEHVDLATGVATEAQLAEHGRERGIAPACFGHAARLVHQTLTQPLGELPPLVEATAIAREVEFAYPIPGAAQRGLVKGFIDALVAYGDDLWVLDYKSDRLDDPAHAADHAADHYGVQARLYALAADRLRGHRTLRGVLFAFVRHGVVVPVAVDLEKASSWLEGLP
jgi:ATP-dependent exoDNAse (exonuclease V) beta subunit